MTSSEKLDAPRTVRDFLVANEQYDDDWADELAALDEVIDDYTDDES